MDTIYKEQALPYNRVSINDVVTLIPLMDAITAEYRTYNKWIKDRQEGKDQKDNTPMEVYVNKANRLYEQLCILRELGFTTSNKNRDIETPQQIDI